MNPWFLFRRDGSCQFSFVGGLGLGAGGRWPRRCLACGLFPCSRVRGSRKGSLPPVVLGEGDRRDAATAVGSLHIRRFGEVAPESRANHRAAHRIAWSASRRCRHCGRRGCNRLCNGSRRRGSCRGCAREIWVSCTRSAHSSEEKPRRRAMANIASCIESTLSLNSRSFMAGIIIERYLID